MGKALNTYVRGVEYTVASTGKGLVWLEGVEISRYGYLGERFKATSAIQVGDIVRCVKAPRSANFRKGSKYLVHKCTERKIGFGPIPPLNTSVSFI